MLYEKNILVWFLYVEADSWVDNMEYLCIYRWWNSRIWCSSITESNRQFRLVIKMKSKNVLKENDVQAKKKWLTILVTIWNSTQIKNLFNKKKEGVLNCGMSEKRKHYRGKCRFSVSTYTFNSFCFLTLSFLLT